MEETTATNYQNGENPEQYQENYNFTEDSGYTGEGQTTEGATEATTEASGDAATGDKINAKDDDERKLFVGGLSWETTQKDLKDYFTTFGEISDVTIKTDPVTGRSRGFGFVLFGDIAAVDKVMAQTTHTLNNRTIDPKRAKARGGREPIKKIFVGGLDPDFPETELREYFGKFGKIEEIELPFDKVKNQRRAFCFITFETEEIVDDICKNAKQTIGTKECDVKKATPRTDAKRGGYGAVQSYGYTGRGRGRGGSYNQSQGWNQSNYNYNQGYGYGQGYGGYSGYSYAPGYDYTSWYDQTGYGSGYGNYGGYGGYGGYDYSNWGYGQDQQGGQQQSTYGKTQKRGSANYHPYSRQ